MSKHTRLDDDPNQRSYEENNLMKNNNISHKLEYLQLSETLVSGSGSIAASSNRTVTSISP